MALTLDQLKVINWIEEWWLSKHSFPPVEQVKNFFPNFDLDSALSDELFHAALNNRGITPTLGQQHESLSNEQLAGIAVLSNFRDTRSPTAKLRSIGVTWTQWNGWMRNKYFKNYLQDVCASNFEDSLDVVQRGILTGVEKGNTEAIKFYLEITGRYTPQSQEVANIKLILARILEVIQIHVKDAETLRAISSDFEKVLQGGSPSEFKEITV